MLTFAHSTRSISLFILVLALALIGAGCGSSSSDDSGSDSGSKASESTGGGEDDGATKGKELFVNSCGSCHALSDAGTSGTVGPSLDDLKPTSEETLSQIKQGGGAMPAGILEGEDAQAVADYVGSVSK